MLQNLKFIRHDFENRLIEGAVIVPASNEDGYYITFVKTDGKVLTLATTNDDNPRLFKTLDACKRLIDEIGFDCFEFCTREIMGV